MTLFNQKSCIESEQDTEKWLHMMFASVNAIGRCACDKCGREFRQKGLPITLAHSLIDFGWLPVDKTEFTWMNEVVSVRKGIRCPKCAEKDMSGVPWCAALFVEHENEQNYKLRLCGKGK